MVRYSFRSRLLALALLLAWGISLPLSPIAVAVAPRAVAPLWQLGHFREYHLPKGYLGPQAITTGPDGNLWFTNNTSNGYNAIGRLTLQGQITEYPIPVSGCFGNPPPGIVVGPDGNLWAIACNALTIVRLNPLSGHMTTYSFPFDYTGYGQPLTVGPDGNLWLLDNINNTVDRFSLTGHTLTHFAIPTQNANAYGITRGADGHLWFSESDAGKLGRLDPKSGQISEYALPPLVYPETIVPGPTGDHRLWFIGGPWLGQLDPFTGQVGVVLTPNGQSGPGLSAGPGGTLWLADGGNQQGEVIGRATDSTQVRFSDYAVPTPHGIPAAITIGPDGNMWFTEEYDGSHWGDKIGMVTTH